MPLPNPERLQKPSWAPGFHGAIVLELLVATLTGGGIAVIGSVVAHRYEHVLAIRQQHRDDLVREVVNPWLQEAERQAHVCDPSAGGLERYVWGGLEEPYEFRRPTYDSPSDRLQGQPIWEQALRHWPHETRLWDACQQRMKELDRHALDLLTEIEQCIDDPPPGVTWAYPNPDFPDRPRHVAASAVWQAYWQVWYQRNGRIDQGLLTDWISRNRVWSDDETQAAMYHRTSAFISENLQEKLTHFLSLLPEVHQAWAAFMEELQRLRHDRNLGGRCAFCPRLMGRKIPS